MPLPKRKSDNHKARKLAERRASFGKPPIQPRQAAAPTQGDIPVVSDLDCAFQGRWRELLPPWEQLTDEEKRGNGPFCRAASSLFFSGGRLEDKGIRVRDGFDKTKVIRYLRATLGDFGPSHEHKIGGIGHMLAKWCEVTRQ